MSTIELPLFIVAGPPREELFDAVRLANEDRKLIFGLAPRANARNAQYWLSGYIETVGPQRIRPLSSHSRGYTGHHWVITLEAAASVSEAGSIVKLQYDSKDRDGFAWDPRTRWSARVWYKLLLMEPLQDAPWLDRLMTFEQFQKKQMRIATRWLTWDDPEEQSA